MRFALEHPARFQLMFRDEKLDVMNEEFVAVAQRSFDALEGAIRTATGTPAQAALSQNGYGFLLANWSIVHGFAHLVLGPSTMGLSKASNIMSTGAVNGSTHHLVIC
jgi:hypothetical protein